MRLLIPSRRIFVYNFNHQLTILFFCQDSLEGCQLNSTTYKTSAETTTEARVQLSTEDRVQLSTDDRAQVSLGEGSNQLTNEGLSQLSSVLLNEQSNKGSNQPAAEGSNHQTSELNTEVTDLAFNKPFLTMSSVPTPASVWRPVLDGLETTGNISLGTEVTPAIGFTTSHNGSWPLLVDKGDIQDEEVFRYSVKVGK